MDLRLLGPVEVRLGDGPIELGPRKQRAVLAMLALRAGRTVSVDALIEGLWGEEPPASAPKMVQLYVSHLRPLLDGGAQIVTRGRGYQLQLSDGEVDVTRFERLLEDSRAREALALWRGDALEDVADEPFAAAEIRHLDERRSHATEMAIDADLAAGRHAEVIGELDRLVAEHPLRERLHAQRMLALYRAGRQSEALAAYQDARTALVEQIGVEPGAELRTLHEAVLAQDPALELAPTPEPETAPRAPRPRRPQQRRVLALAAVLVIAGVTAFGVIRVLEPEGLPGIRENAVGLIDAAGDRITSQLPVGRSPGAAAAGAGSVWIASASDGTVSRLDRDNRRITTVDVGGEPTAVAFGDGSLWVADGQHGQVAQVDSRTNRVVNRLPTGNAPRGVAVAGGAVWLASAIDGQVDRLDLAHSGRIHRIDVPGGPAAIAAGAGAVWVAGEQDGVVTKLDPRSGAALKPIGVGSGPAAIAVGYGGVWVANRDDGTVTRIDANTDAVSETVAVGGRPVAVAAGLGAIWVADAGKDTVIRIDPKTRRVSHRLALRSAPSGLAVAGGSLWAAATVSRAAHRGGTLRFASAPFYCKCMDPAGYDGDDWPVLTLAYDGLVAYRRVPGAGGSTIVPDLATSVPEPTDGGRTYTFQLRSGLRFSDGTPVRPEDFRASIERVVRLAGQIVPYYTGIVGGPACSARKCDLSKGIETDAAARTIVIHLQRPDPEFMHKLAIPIAVVLPSRAPATMIRARPPPGTGPYTIAAFTARSGARLVRNARFRSWSPDARPDGFADRIAVTAAPGASAQVAAVRAGRADAAVAAGSMSGEVPVAQGRMLALRAAHRVSTAPEPFATYLFLNTHEPPFDDVRVRRAMNYAVDRRRMVELAGGSGVAGLTCQLIPPGLPGYVPTCPFTVAPTRGGGWTAPDLAHARRLVAASGSRGARVRVFAGPKYARIGHYTGDVLRRLGYRVRVRVLPDFDGYSRYITDTRHHVQVGIAGWVDDFLTSSSFFDPLSCRHLIRGSSANENPSQFCDPAIDAAAADALAAHGTDANTRWAALDRRVLADAPTVPLFSRRALLYVSDRVGNPEIHPLLGPLLDQFWVR